MFFVAYCKKYNRRTIRIIDGGTHAESVNDIKTFLHSRGECVLCGPFSHVEVDMSHFNVVLSRHFTNEQKVRDYALLFAVTPRKDSSYNYDLSMLNTTTEHDWKVEVAKYLLTVQSFAGDFLEYANATTKDNVSRFMDEFDIPTEHGHYQVFETGVCYKPGAPNPHEH